MAIQQQPRISPHEARLLVREQPHFNSETERAAIAEVDNAVFDVVRVYDRQIAEDIMALIEQNKATAADAEALRSELHEQVTRPLLEGSLPTNTMAATYQDLVRRAEQLEARIDTADRNAEFLTGKAEDPYAAFSQIMDKYPMLRPALVSS